MFRAIVLPIFRNTRLCVTACGIMWYNDVAGHRPATSYVHYTTSCNTQSSVPVFLQVLFEKWGHAVAQLVEALRYKSGGRGFDPRWCHWNFSLTQFFRPHYDPGVDLASKRNEYQQYFLGVKVAVA